MRCHNLIKATGQWFSYKECSEHALKRNVLTSYNYKTAFVLECSRDPNIGSLADSCYTADVTISVNTTLPGAPLTDIRMFVLNCSVMSLCSFLKDQTCGALETVFEGMPQIHVKNCDVKCCQGDLCNDPSTSDESSVKVPQTTTLCGMLVLIALTFMNF